MGSGHSRVRQSHLVVRCPWRYLQVENKVPCFIDHAGDDQWSFAVSARRNDAQVYAVEYRLEDSRDGYQAVLTGLAMRYAIYLRVRMT